MMKNQKLINKIAILKIALVFAFFMVLSFQVFGQNRTELERVKKVSPQNEEIDNSTRFDSQKPVRRLKIPADLLQIRLVEVPSLVGREFNRNEIIDILKRSRLQIGESIPVENQRIGIVLTQYPTTGTRVRPGTTVNITYGIESPQNVPENVTVENYIGMRQEQVYERMLNDGVTLGDRTGVNSDQPPGIVVGQFPPAGTIVDPETKVNLDISSGPPVENLIEIPDLVGREFNQDEIMSILKRSRLRFGESIPVENQRVGVVITQYPIAGTMVRPGVAVNITYGIERPQEILENISVGNYIGMTETRAVERMPNDRITPGSIRGVNSDQPPGIVVGQFPLAGTIVDPETSVSLDISIGVPKIVMVEIPRLLDLTLQQAAEVLRESGLFVGKIDEQVSHRPEGVITGQSPMAGSKVKQGAAVDIIYSIHELVPVPNVRGLPRDEAIQKIKKSMLKYSIKYIEEPGISEGKVTDQFPEPETMVTVGSEVTISIQTKSTLPPWVYWGGGILVAALAGGFIGRKIKPKQRNKLVGEKDTIVHLNPVWDVGIQTITCEENLVQNRIHLKYIPDYGTQTLKTN